MTTLDKSKLAKDPLKRVLTAYEPDVDETKKLFRDVPSAAVIITPTTMIWREDLE